jgi:hypothetical protein
MENPEQELTSIKQQQKRFKLLLMITMMIEYDRLLLLIESMLE